MNNCVNNGEIHIIEEVLHECIYLDRSCGTIIKKIHNIRSMLSKRFLSNTESIKVFLAN